MRTTKIKEAEHYALKISSAGFTEFIYNTCGKSFFFINEKSLWENYGVYLHTVCLLCGYTKEVRGPAFKQIEHHNTIPP